MRVIAFPFAGSAYTDAFYGALKVKVEVVSGDWSGRWLWSNLRRDDVVHMHWPSFYYRADGGVLNVYWHFLWFALFLLFIRVRVTAVFWTAHNVLPHTRCVIPRVDLWVRLLMIKLASRIFIHGAEAEKVFTKQFPCSTGKIVNIPHGNWLGYYADAPSKRMARQQLNLPDQAFVFELFGYCQPYKNLHGLVRAFLRIATANDYLLNAGRFGNEAYREEIEGLAAGHANIRIDSHFIPNADVPTYTSACDVICVPYQEVLTSGTAMLALTYGRPVLSIDRGFLRDVVPPSVGLLIEPGEEDALVRGMLEIKQTAWSEAHIRSHAQSFKFAHAADIFFTELSLLNSEQIELNDC